MLIALPGLLAAAPLPDAAALPLQPDFPNPLVNSSGQPVVSKEQWMNERAPELRALFQHYEYGLLPAKPAKVDATVEREDHEALEGKATLKEVTLSWGLPGVQIHLLLVTPNGRGPAPVFLGLSFAGVQEALDDPKIRISDAWTNEPKDTHHATEASRGRSAVKWHIKENVARGYGVAIFYTADVVPDEVHLAQERLKLFRPAERAEAPADDDCATLAAWASGLMRVVDYLVTDPAVDAKRIAVVGHSRNGKTALLAGAMDQRIALIIPAQAGCGGTAPSRVTAELSTPGANGRSIVETVGRINTSFPHWFCGNFKKFNDEPARLPFDQHELIALCAPRPVLISAATEDLWANPSGQFDLLRRADPVYRLVSGEGLEAAQMPEPLKLVGSRLGYFIRPGKHEVNETDWNAWLDYADKWLK